MAFLPLFASGSAEAFVFAGRWPELTIGWTIFWGAVLDGGNEERAWDGFWKTGGLEVESEEGKGTTFRVMLPARKWETLRTDDPTLTSEPPDVYANTHQEVHYENKHRP
ncbi:MAG: hypothetical protein ABSD38_38530 [Syntrophorhabdales bacterium]|jgi:hypothetical protein